MIWLIGNKGMLGAEVQKQLEENKLHFVATGSEVDITNIEAMESFVTSIDTSSYFPSSLPRSLRKIKWIINCAAYTDVEGAEENPEAAARLNCEGPCNIARIARKIGAKLIHISTDYVFDGNSNTPFLEDGEKNPLGVYGKTKAEGEFLICKEMTQYFIIRTSWLYGFDGKNFVYTMTRLMNENSELKVINDQKGSPTCAVDLAAVIIRFIEKTENAKGFIGSGSTPAFGIYHYTNGDEATWYEFAREIYRIGKKTGRITNECKLIPCDSSEYPSKVQRPSYSVLNKTKIVEILKVKIPSWQKSLEKFMKNKRFEVK